MLAVRVRGGGFGRRGVESCCGKVRREAIGELVSVDRVVSDRPLDRWAEPYLLAARFNMSGIDCVAAMIF